MFVFVRIKQAIVYSIMYAVRRTWFSSCTHAWLCLCIRYRAKDSRREWIISSKCVLILPAQILIWMWWNHPYPASWLCVQITIDDPDLERNFPRKETSAWWSIWCRHDGLGTFIFHLIFSVFSHLIRWPNDSKREKHLCTKYSYNGCALISSWHGQLTVDTVTHKWDLKRRQLSLYVYSIMYNVCMYLYIGI